MTTKANLIIPQGATYETQISLSDADGAVFDLTNYTGRSYVKKHFTSLTYHEFTVNLSNSGILTLSMTAEQTSNIEPGRYRYDVEIQTGNTVLRVIEGEVRVTPEVTK